MSFEIFTIGHSTHPIGKFIALLQRHTIGAVADVRSSPFSKMNPQYNRENLKAALKEAGIHYVFLGRELGARSDDPACYVGSKVSYTRIAQTPRFADGIARVLTGAQSYRIALMCAERDPLQCHRTILVTRELVARGVAVTHILDNGGIEPHADAMKRLAGELGLAGGDMFRSPEEGIHEAYAVQGERMAYDRDRAADQAAKAARARRGTEEN